MTNPVERPIYRIFFSQQDEVKVIYAQYISEETLVGFIEADTLLDYDPSTAIVDCSEVRRCYIPLHTILRIDEVQPQASVNKTEKIADNVSHLPHVYKKSTSRRE